MTRVWIWVPVVLLMWFGTAYAAETGTLLRQADLKAKPFLDAETLIKLPEKTPVEIVQRQGPWMLVKVQDKTGYVRMLQVRMSVADSAQARAAARAPGWGVTAAASRPAGATTTVTTGVRGFDEQALKNAQPDPAAFARMASFAMSGEQARQFAQKSPLAARSISYYDASGKSVKGVK